MRPWPELRATLADCGLNAVGVADGAPYQDWLPGCRAVVVVGSGGPALWEAFVSHLRDHPADLIERADPLDDFVRARIRAADPGGPGRRWAFADTRQDPHVPIQDLALAAGLGWRSKLWLVLHPDFGPWLGLRAACFTTEALPIDGPLAGLGPCGDCPAPCVGACPGRALRSGAMDWKWCAVHRAATQDCVAHCHSRLACPEGAARRYPPEERLYHHDKVRGRAALVEALKLEDQAGTTGTDWAAVARRAWDGLLA